MAQPTKLRAALESISGAEDLAELALDMRWSWSHAADELWGKIDPELWEITHNPWVVFQDASPAKIKQLLKEKSFRAEVDRLRAHQLSESDTAVGGESATWFHRAYPGSKLKTVAYFSMEFGLSEALPIYSGGLGNVAGDQLKSASDLGIPVIGVGLLYQQGYFRQVIEADGSQRAVYPYNDPSQLPILPLRDSTGEWLRIRVQLPGCAVWLRAWEARVGRVRLLLLDSNDPANPPAYRGVTSELYGGGTEMRLQQELILGVMGYRMLHTLGIRPDVCHLNEGHAGFAVWERARLFMEETGQPFDVARLATRAGNLFTTHTPVDAGIDRFPAYLIEPYLREYATDLHVKVDDLLAMGRANPNDPNEPFNMAYLGIRGCGAVNGVSQLHAQVSRKMFSNLFPRWPVAEVPVACVTNGVHVPSWDSSESDALWHRACGSDRWRSDLDELDEKIRAVSDEELWKMRCTNRVHLVDAVRTRNRRQESSIGARFATDQSRTTIFDPNVLTLGFARRFATYKRPNLLLRNPERLIRILTNSKHPVQLVVAGKAHPEDREGQRMIQEWVQFSRWQEVQGRVVFLSDYDMSLAEQLVQGVDVWINTPRRPWEACGTSGMKVLVNGGLNLSSLDGWWAEAYDSSLGWKVGDHQDYPTEAAQDAAEGEQLYSVLENEVIPLFYRRESSGIPSEWVAMMRESMARLTGQYSANRSVREYTERFYLPAAEAYTKRTEDHGNLAIQIRKSQTELQTHWSEIHFHELDVSYEENDYLIQARVYLGTVCPEHVRVEIFADNPDGASFISEMSQTGALVGVQGGFVFEAKVPATRPASDYTVRIVSALDTLAVPLEEPLILWQQ
ncbi:MAG: alpha-glucan family phosphorylase [Terracidiphilus sp.]|nr:alpha-glucan family phosphorylase [Terracidiphilus sp.]MDR3775711.1 alpha-glucan family phosphorylase [Terracidiphilus sp.]